MKRCFTCQKMLPLTLFFKEKSKKDGLRSTCKKCQRLHKIMSGKIKGYKRNPYAKVLRCIMCKKSLSISRFPRVGRRCKNCTRIFRNAQACEWRKNPEVACRLRRLEFLRKRKQGWSPLFRKGYFGYRQAHSRIVRNKGRASGFICACGNAAKDWALKPETKIENLRVDNFTKENGKVFSIDMSDYIPKCRDCNMQDGKPTLMGWSQQLLARGLVSHPKGWND